MSKRAGAIVSLQDIIDTVGKDVARFFYLNRKADAQLEFDLGLHLKKLKKIRFIMCNMHMCAPAVF